MATRREFLKLLPAFGAGLYVACGGGSDDEGGFDDQQVLGNDAELRPIITNSEVVLGPNRLAFGLLDEEGLPVSGAKVHLIFYDLSTGQAVPKFETDAVARSPAKDAGIQEQVVHNHADGTRHIHVNVGEDIGIYTANVTFDREGDWGVEMQIESSKPAVKTTVRPRFNVIRQGPSPMIGAQAPRTRQQTLKDVPDIAQLDTAANPLPEFHQMTIADAIAARRPLMVLFATPGYCTSRLCGPEYEIMRKLHATYKAQAEFIQIEPYKNPTDQTRVVTDAMKEWNLQTEPWFFVIDGTGKITARFEGPTSLQELDEALKPVLG